MAGAGLAGSPRLRSKKKSRVLAPGFGQAEESCLPAARGRLEAIRAINRSVIPRHEWDHRLAAASRACRGVHLALRPIRISALCISALRIATLRRAATLRVPPLRTTAWAALGILVPARRMKLLIVGTEVELGAALHAGQETVSVYHAFFHLWSGQKVDNNA